MSRLSLDRIVDSLSSRGLSPSRLSTSSRGPSPNRSIGSRKSAEIAQAHQVLTCRTIPSQPDVKILERAGFPNPDLPLFSFRRNKSKPNIIVHRIGAGNAPILETFIGDASVSASTSSVKINLQGQAIKLKINEMTLSSYNFTSSMGKFKWKSDSLAGNAIALTDGSSMKLARYMPGERLEVLVPCDDHFLDLVVVTALSAAAIMKKDGENAEAAGEIISALLGG